MIIVSDKTRMGLNPLWESEALAIKILDKVDELASRGLEKTASANATDTLISALSKMNLKVNVDLGELLAKVKEEQSLTKTASEPTRDEARVAVVSKYRQDSHYEFDIHRDSVTHKGRKLALVSMYLRDTYLGRYLIKRNFYLVDQKEAEATFGDMVRRAELIRRRYYDDTIPVNSIFQEAKAYLDGLRGDIEQDSPQ